MSFERFPAAAARAAARGRKPPFNRDLNCAVDGCFLPVKATDLCSFHYNRRRRGADMGAPKRRYVRRNEANLAAPTPTDQEDE